MKNTSTELAPLVEALKQEIPTLIAIYQFGSFGTSAMRADSDIDLGLRSCHRYSHAPSKRKAARVAAKHT